MKNNKWKRIKETTEKSFDFMNKSELQSSFEDILNETIDQWKENDDKDSLDMAEQGEAWKDDYINDPEWGLVASTMRDMKKYVHRSDTGMSGNFADIRLDWEREHEDVSLDEVVEMIDNGEINDITNEFRSWSVDWYFRAFGTYNLKYNWGEFISNEVAEMDYERERDSEVDE